MHGILCIFRTSVMHFEKYVIIIRTLFMAPHLVRAQGAYEDIRLRSFHHHTCMRACMHTHTHTQTHMHTLYKYMHYWVGRMRGKKITDWYEKYM